MSLITATEHQLIAKQLANVNRNVKYIIQGDSPSKRFKFRVVTMSGVLVGYFKKFDDATNFCNSN
jgi:hypothetical protein